MAAGTASRGRLHQRAEHLEKRIERMLHARIHQKLGRLAAHTDPPGRDLGARGTSSTRKTRMATTTTGTPCVAGETGETGKIDETGETGETDHQATCRRQARRNTSGEKNDTSSDKTTGTRKDDQSETRYQHHATHTRQVNADTGRNAKRPERAAGLARDVQGEKIDVWTVMPHA